MPPGDGGHPQEAVVSYADKPLTCRECGLAFLFTAGEQEFFAAKGFDRAPSRCPECRAARRAERGDPSPDHSPARSREMYTATCAACGRDARVPFRPRSDRPVYCSACYQEQRGSSGPDRSRQSWR